MSETLLRSPVATTGWTTSPNVHLSGYDSGRHSNRPDFTKYS